MTSRRYAGAAPVNPGDIVTRLTMQNLIGAATPNQISAASDVQTAAALKAAKTYVDTQDAQFVSPSYYQSQDALNIPNTARGVALGAALTGSTFGVASLDSGSHIPIGQFPAIGSGFIVGPYGPTSTAAGSATTTPVKIADWNIGPQATSFQPFVFAAVMATPNSYGRPVVEIRISDGQKAYSFQTLVASGFGRSNYNDEQCIDVWPAPGNPGQTGGTSFAPTTNTWLSAWLYDPTGNGVSVASNSIVSGAVFLLRNTV